MHPADARGHVRTADGDVRCHAIRYIALDSHDQGPGDVWVPPWREPRPDAPPDVALAVSRRELLTPQVVFPLAHAHRFVGFG